MDFLQIPPHDGHPCLWLTVPTAKSVADFHRQVITHAERTKQTPTDLKICRGYLFVFCDSILAVSDFSDKDYTHFGGFLF